MSIDWMAAMRRARALDNWQDAETLIDSLIGQAGLTDESTLQAQAEYGRKCAEVANAKGKQGRKI